MMEQDIENSSGHQHYWSIAQANGPTSPGVCKHCGANREFRNWLSETDFMGREELTGASSPDALNRSRATRSSW